MAKNIKKSTTNEDKLDDGTLLPHPSTLDDSLWKDDMKMWPQSKSAHILYYLIEKKACDFRASKCFKSLDSYNYFESGWVPTVYAQEPVKNIIYLKCNVTPSQALNEETRKSWTIVRRSGEILAGGCTCLAGLGKTCSHVGALMWKVDCANKKGLVGVACTDELLKWNSGSKRNIEPILVKNIIFKKPKQGIEVDALVPQSINDTTLNLQRYDSRKEMIDKLEKEGLGPLMKIPGTILNNTIYASPKPTNPNIIHCQIHPIHHHTNIANLPESCAFCAEFYNKFINISHAKKIELQNATLKKSNSDSQLWQESRRLRITASTANNVPKRSSTNPQKFLLTHLFKPFTGNKFTDHGNLNEKKAIKYLSEILSRNIEKAGTFVSEKDPWLSASPDGLIGEDEIVEVKCPFPDGKEFNHKKVDLMKNSDDETILKI